MDEKKTKFNLNTITMSELRKTFRTMKPTKSTGWDTNFKSSTEANRTSCAKSD